MKAVVTGGAGFVGSNIAHTLVDEGHEVHVIDDLSTGHRSNVPEEATLHELDLRNRDSLVRLLEQIQPTHVSHQAAQASVPRSVANPLEDASRNVQGTLNLLEGCREVGVEGFILASSGGALYGEVPEDSKGAQECLPLNPKSPYGAAKGAAEQYVQAYAEGFEVPSVILRYSNVYGPRQSPQGEAGVVAIFIDRILQGESVHVNARREEGDDGCFRDYVFVEDVARANLNALKGDFNWLPQEQDAVYNVGTGNPKSTHEVLETICSVMGENPEVEYRPPRPGDLKVNFLDTSRIGRRGWNPETGFREGIDQTVQWFEAEDEEL